MEFKDKINQSVAAAVAKIMGEALHPNQQKLDVHEPEKDELTAADFKKLRSGKKSDMKKEEIEIEEESHQSKTTMKHIPNASPALKKAAKDIKPGIAGIRDRFDMLDAGGVKREHVENLDEVSLKTATSAYVKRMGKDDDKSPVKAVKTMDHIAKKHGVVGVARAAKAADKEYGLNDPVHNKRKDFVKGVMAGVKEEVEAIDEVKMADLPSTKVQGRSYGASKPQPSAFDVLKGPKDKELKSIETEKKKPVKEDIELTLDDYLLEELVEFVMSEEFQQLDELSKSTLGSYVTKASKDMRSHSQMAGSKDTALMAHQMGYRRGEKSPIKGGTKGEKRVSSEIAKHQTKASNRTAGIAGAAQRLAKEQFEITEEDAYDKNVKPSDKPHDKDAAKKRAQTSAVAARKIMSMSSYSAKKNAIKEETESEHYKAGHEYASDHAQDSGFKVTARARKKEMLADNPHKKGTKEHTDWHQGALHGHQTALENM